MATPSPRAPSAPTPEDDRLFAPGGLSTEEARQRLARFGRNEPAPTSRGAGAGQFFLFLTNPLVLILLAASVISAFTGDRVNAAIIVLMVVLSVTLNFVQAFRSQRAAERLRNQVAPTATVMRDGAWAELHRAEVVPGDLIRLSAGDLVPADARLIEVHDLHVQQAALTGESLPVEKVASTAQPHTAQSPADALDMVFLGTSVMSGVGIASVITTGRATVLGEVAGRLVKRAPETEFDRGLRHFGFLILRAVILLVLFVFLASLVAKHAPLESLLFAIALAVGLTPEFLPMITTVTLGQGALHMAKRKVIVKHLAAIQNFGSIDILCSDKTGTLTTGEMILEKSLDPYGAESPLPLLLASINSRFETGMKSPLDTAILARGDRESESYHKLDELPFDFERRRLSVVA
ncbi:MAG TPA: HAD-IC family P-type ATPase, partial [Ktedonobacterales bacterium]